MTAVPCKRSLCRAGRPFSSSRPASVTARAAQVEDLQAAEVLQVDQAVLLTCV